MKTLTILFVVSATLLATMKGCGPAGAADMRSEDGNLTFDGFYFPLRKPNGRLQRVKKPPFHRGETVALVLENVRGFEPNDQGRYEYNMDLRVDDADGEVVREETELFGLDHEGPLDSANVAKAPFAYLEIHEHDPKGRFLMVVTMYDNVGGGSVSQEAVISIE